MAPSETRKAASSANRAEPAPSERAQMTTFFSGPTSRDELQSWQGKLLARCAEPRTEAFAYFHIELDIHGGPPRDGRQGEPSGSGICRGNRPERGGQPRKQTLEIQALE